MDKLLFSIIVGFIIGIVDIVPMIVKKLPKYSTIASFFHYFFVTIVIINIELPYIPWWLEGGILGFVLMVPMLIHVGHEDKKPLPVIAINAIILGSIAGFISHFFF